MVSARVLTDEDVKVMEIEREMFPHLDAEQSRRLHSALERVLIPPPPYMDNDQFVAAFAEAKRVQGCSERTTKYYAAELARASKVVGKPWERWTSDDARSYMSWSFSHGSNETTVNTKYRVLSTFFMWMEGEEYVPRSVMRKVSQVKVPRRRRKPFTSVEVDAMRSACRDDRERTVLEMLLSSQLLNNRLLLNGNFGYKNNATQKQVFIGEFDLEYKLTRSGDIRLKAYNHANDMYQYLKQSLTTQGVGIMFKKDFTRFGDLFRRRPRLTPLVSAPDTTRTEMPK